MPTSGEREVCYAREVGGWDMAEWNSDRGDVILVVKGYELYESSGLRREDEGVSLSSRYVEVHYTGEHFTEKGTIHHFC